MQPKINYPGDYFATEISNALFKFAVATGIVIASGVATVTSATHLLSTGDLVTFSGVTGAGVTGLNGATWGPVTVTNSSVYTFPCSLVGTIGGSPIQEKLYFPVSGYWLCVLGANGQLEYNPDGRLGLNSAQGGIITGNCATADAWRILIAASAAGDFFTDGFSVRFRENGTTATSYFSQVK